MRPPRTRRETAGAGRSGASARWSARQGLLLIGLLLGAPAWCQVIKLGGEFRVNSYTTSYQESPRVAGDGAGSFVVVWSSYMQDGSKHGVYAQRYDATGTRLDTEFRVNTYTRSYQNYPSVAVNDPSRFVVAWQSYRQDGSYFGVFGQRYSNAAPAGGEFQVNTYTNYDQIYASVAGDTAGRFIVVWQSAEQDGSGGGVYGQRYDAAGLRQGSPFRVNTYTTNYQARPRVGKDGTGRFVVVWQSFGQDGASWGVYGQRYDASATKLGSEFRVNSYTTAAQRNSEIGVSSSGSFVALWESPQDGSGYGIFGQRYNSSGTKVGGEFQVNTFTTGDQRFPAVAMDGSGSFVAVWQSPDQDGSSLGVFAQRYDSTGARRGAEFQVNTYTIAGQSSPSVFLDAAGNFTVVWQSTGQDGSGTGIYGQRFNIQNCSPLSVTGPGDQTGCAGGTVVFTITSSGSGPFSYQWRKGLSELQDGPFISGSRTPTLRVKQVSSVDAGSYSCVVSDACLPQAVETSAVGTLTYSSTPAPGRVTGLRLRKVQGGSSLQMTWNDTTDATDYVVLQDSNPGGAFAAVTGSSASGTAGITIPLDASTRFYLAAGRSAACGIGPTD